MSVWTPDMLKALDYMGNLASTKMVPDPKATLGLGVGFATGVEGVDTLRRHKP